jgi:hypothetical protein
MLRRVGVVAVRTAAGRTAGAPPATRPLRARLEDRDPVGAIAGERK